MIETDVPSHVLACQGKSCEFRVQRHFVFVLVLEVPVGTLGGRNRLYPTFLIPTQRYPSRGKELYYHRHGRKRLGSRACLRKYIVVRYLQDAQPTAHGSTRTNRSYVLSSCLVCTWPYRTGPDAAPRVQQIEIRPNPPLRVSGFARMLLSQMPNTQGKESLPR